MTTAVLLMTYRRPENTKYILNLLKNLIKKIYLFLMMELNKVHIQKIKKPQENYT